MQKCEYGVSGFRLAVGLLRFLFVPKLEPEFFCLECGCKDSVERFGPFIRCPLCGSSDALNYRLWKRHGADTPPPRIGRLTLADFNRAERLGEEDAHEKAGEQIPFKPKESAG